MALHALLATEGRAATGNALVPKLPHRAPKAREVIQIFCPGGLIHVDTWDYKPELQKRQ